MKTGRYTGECRICLLVMLFALCHASYGQGTIVKRDTAMMFHFKANSSQLFKVYRNNEKSLEKLYEVITNPVILSRLDSVVIEATSSPEGGKKLNQELAEQRGVSLKTYIRWKSNRIPEEKIIVKFSVTGWQTLKKDIAADKNFPFKELTLEAISADVPSLTIDWRLRQVGNGVVWKYLKDNYLWRYTSALSIVYYLNISDKPYGLDVDIARAIQDIEQAESRLAAERNDELPVKTDTVIETVTQEATETVQPESCTREPAFKPLFAVKTNLLFDAATILNVEMEVPIGRRWSIAGEWIFPWWKQDNGRANSKRNRLQLLSGTVEGRYWFGDRTKRPQLTGWFAGVYAGGGLYDIERKAKGYQGEFFIMGGLSGGFTHTINKKGNLRMEYALGIGYLQTDYRRYEAFYSENHACEIKKAHNWHPVHKENGRYTWIGPTKLKVSLVWMIGKGGVK